jgi:hypothetical protein
VPKPWFWSQPDENGSWSDKRLDDDVWFWKQFREAGRRVWVDGETRIGHMEEMISMYDENLQPVHLYPDEWFNKFMSSGGQQAK